MWRALKLVCSNVAALPDEDLAFRHPRVTLLVTGPGAWSDAVQQHLQADYGVRLHVNSSTWASLDTGPAVLVASTLLLPYRAFGDSFDRPAPANQTQVRPR